MNAVPTPHGEWIVNAAVISDDVRRQAEKLLTDAQIEALDFDIESPCEEPHHGEGQLGCRSGPATHIVRYSHGRSRGDPCEPLIVLVCVDRAIWIRGAAAERVHCPKCKLVATIRDFVSVIGPIAK